MNLCVLCNHFMLLQPTYVQVGYTLEINVLIWLSHIQHDSGSSIPTYLKKMVNYTLPTCGLVHYKSAYHNLKSVTLPKKGHLR